MFGIISTSLFKQAGKSQGFKKFVVDFVSQSLVDEANDQLGTNVYTEPTPGGTTATTVRKIFQGGSDKKSGGSKIPELPKFNLGQNSNLLDGMKKSESTNKGDFQKAKCYFYKFPEYNYVMRRSYKEELFVVIVTSVYFLLLAAGTPWAIYYYVPRIRAYVDGLTEREAEYQLGLWQERRNRDTA